MTGNPGIAIFDANAAERERQLEHDRREGLIDDALAAVTRADRNVSTFRQMVEDGVAEALDLNLPDPLAAIMDRIDQQISDWIEPDHDDIAVAIGELREEDV